MVGIDIVGVVEAATVATATLSLCSSLTPENRDGVKVVFEIPAKASDFKYAVSDIPSGRDSLVSSSSSS